MIKNAQTSTELATMFLKGRDSAWLSVKQVAWLKTVICQERGDRVSHKSYSLGNADDLINGNPHGYDLEVMPNGAALLKPVPCSGDGCYVCAFVARRAA